PIASADFGASLRRHRAEAGLTQEELAERAGLSARGISDLERGVRSAPRIDTVRLLCDALQLLGSDRAALMAAARTPVMAGDGTRRPTTTLPVSPTALIGREEDVAGVRQQLLRPDVRLLTLTGTAGTGKTRLAVAVAAGLQGQFADGVHFVDLAPLTDPDLVITRIAQALGVVDEGGDPPLDRLQRRLRSRPLLLVLDNFEHVLAAAPGIARLLETCPDLTVLVTSRAALHLRWEHEYAVPPLRLPDLARPLDLEAVAATPAVALLVERAQAVDRDFRLSEANARSVAELCRHLDGLPLAIELAAAWMKVLLPHALLPRLRQRFDLLVTGAADLPRRQRTLRAAIDWSYDLLLPEERALFRRLAVFAGGCTLDGAEAVCTGEAVAGEAVPLLLARLVDASLVVVERSGHAERPEVRYRLLETLRQYAADRLDATGEAATFRERHLGWFLAFAERAEPELRGPQQVPWLDRLEVEEDNLGGALEWSAAGSDRERGLRLATALCWFWFVRGRRSEGRAWLERLLTPFLGDSASAATRAAAFSAAGFLAHDQRDYGPARAWQDESLRLAQAVRDDRAIAVARGLLGYLALHQRDFARAKDFLEVSLVSYRALRDGWGAAWVLNALGLVALRLSDYATAEGRFEESAALFRSQGDQWGIAWTLRGLAQIALDRGDYARATTLWQERVMLSERLRDMHGTAYSLDYVATVARLQGNYEQSAALFERSLALWRAWGDNQCIAWTLNAMGDLALARGDHDAAWRLFQESLTLRQELGEHAGIATSLEGLAAHAAACRQPWRALWLAGAADALHRATGIPSSLVERATLERRLDPIRETLSAADAAEAWAAGASTPLEQVLASAREEWYCTA
ncbi:MAG: ATP-binding protein, partial [Chloroflexota bacterium]